MKEKFKKYKWQFITFSILVVALLTLDLVLKAVAENAFKEKVMILPNFISFVFVKNTGMAWGLLSNNTILLAIISVVFISILIYFYLSFTSPNYLYHVGFALVICGGLGNLIDRVFLGYVRDFINFEFMNFPVFNIADALLTIGVILLVIYLIFILPKEIKKRKNETTSK